MVFVFGCRKRDFVPSMCWLHHSVLLSATVPFVILIYLFDMFLSGVTQ